MENDSTRVVIMWPDIGEHHIARLRGATRRCPELEIIGLATVGGAGRQWLPLDGARPDGLRIETLFPAYRVADLQGERIARSVHETLSRLMPHAVAVCGWR